jgi:hypothetical protein
VLDFQYWAFEGVHGLPGAEANANLVCKKRVNANVRLTFVVVAPIFTTPPIFYST